MSDAKKGAAGLYGIIAIKLGKGLLLLAVALGVYSLAGYDLTALFEKCLRVLNLDPESSFFQKLEVKIGQITPTNVRWVAAGTFTYSMICLVEGIGLCLRISWAGWLAIGESLFFIPIEVYELHRSFSVTVLGILIFNIFICYYLFHNRARLFKHHYPTTEVSQAAGSCGASCSQGQPLSQSPSQQ